ncbi:unnamed protein product [Urochloa humidicola]
MASLSEDFWSLGEIYRLRRLTGVAEHWIYFSFNSLEWDAYDPDRRCWIPVPNMPMDECFTCSDKESLAVGTDLLVFVTDQGVEHTLFSLFRYSILTNSWIQTGPMNYPRTLFGSASVGLKAYLAGGSDCYGRVLTSVEMYDSEENEWWTLPSMNMARKLCSGVFMDRKFYVIGGRGSKNEELTCGEEYDFERGSWRVIKDMCEGLNVQASGAPPLVAVVKNELYAADYSEKNVKKYDKLNNTWITLGKWPESIVSMSTNGWGIGFKACGDQLIIIGGPRNSVDCMVELNSWVPDEQPPVWNMIAKHPSGNFVYNATVMSC